MRRWAIELALLIAVAGLATTADQRMRSLEVVAAAGRPLPGAPAAPVIFDDDTLAAASDAVAARDPFRMPGARLAATHVESAPAAHAPRPVLTLKAIVGGPPWQAVVAGLPGKQGDVVISTGDRFDALVVRAIGRDTVVVTGADTTWMLTLQRTRP